MQVSPTSSCYLQISIVILTLFKFIVLCDCATISASLFTLDLYLPLSLGRALYLEVQGILISSYLSLLSEKGGASHLVSRAHLLLKSGQVEWPGTVFASAWPRKRMAAAAATVAVAAAVTDAVALKGRMVRVQCRSFR